MNHCPVLPPCMILYYSPQEKSFLAGPANDNQPALIEVTNEEAHFLMLCDGNLTISEIAARLHRDEGDVKTIATKFSGEPHAVLQFLEEEKNDYTPDPHTEIAYQILNELDSANSYTNNITQLHQYHTETISDAVEQFESTETTIAHAYSRPHPSLGGVSYGAKFAKELSEIGLIDKGKAILEIGGGTGYLARDFLKYLKDNKPRTYKHIHYTMLELSPVLIKSQKEQTALHRPVISHVTGDALAAPFSSGTFSLIIANEMIADLPSVRMKKEWVDNGSADQIPRESLPALKFIKNFNIPVDDAFPEFLVNLGAWQMMEKIYHLLSHGGTAVIIEYGSPCMYPVAVHLKEHTEYSIHFGHLEKIANKLGFETRLEGLADFLKMDPDVQVLNSASFGTLNQSILPHFNMKPLPTLSFTPEMLGEFLGDLYHNLHNLQFHPLKEAAGPGNPSAFYALTLFKREAQPS